MTNFKFIWYYGDRYSIDTSSIEKIIVNESIGQVKIYFFGGESRSFDNQTLEGLRTMIDFLYRWDVVEYVKQ